MTRPKKTIQLRRYSLDPARIDEFGPGWASRIPALRKKYGFSIEFAYLDRAASTFVWAVSIAGDHDEFLRRDAQYYAAPEKQAGTPPDRKGLILKVDTSFLESVEY